MSYTEGKQEQEDGDGSDKQTIQITKKIVAIASITRRIFEKTRRR